MRSLGKIKQIVEEATGLDITHVFDDLVFVENSAFLIRFDHRNFNQFYLHFHRDCGDPYRKDLLNEMEAAAQGNGMKCLPEKDFTMEQIPGKEEVRITFF